MVIVLDWMDTKFGPLREVSTDSMLLGVEIRLVDQTVEENQMFVDSKGTRYERMLVCRSKGCGNDGSNVTVSEVFEYLSHVIGLGHRATCRYDLSCLGVSPPWTKS